MMLKNHLDMIGRNEPIQRKAKFWQSYVRALKGTDDMRAPDRVSTRPRSIFRPFLADYPELSSGWPYAKSIYDDPIHAVDRISVPGYRYLPVSREIYGYSPRNLYPAPYRPAPVYDAQKAWDDHLKRLADIDRLYPSKYPLSARHASPTSMRELTPEEKEKPFYNYAGVPIWNRGGYTRRPLSELFEPSTSLPISRIARDPWWWSYPSLRPYTLPYGWSKYPFYLRDSYLSPVKRTYLWGQHPIRPFDSLKYTSFSDYYLFPSTTPSYSYSYLNPYSKSFYRYYSDYLYPYSKSSYRYYTDYLNPYTKSSYLSDYLYPYTKSSYFSDYLYPYSKYSYLDYLYPYTKSSYRYYSDYLYPYTKSSYYPGYLYPYTKSSIYSDYLYPYYPRYHYRNRYHYRFY